MLQKRKILIIDTGYVVFNSDWGTRTDLTDGYGFASATPSEYIQTKGGPHSGNIYSSPEYRTSNLEFGGPSGSTIEFFYNKETGLPDNAVQGTKQVVFDLYNRSENCSNFKIIR